MLYVSTFLLSLFVAMAVIPVLRRLALRCGAVDLPAPRKMHAAPTPRIGGLGIALGALVPLLLWSQPSVFLRSLFFGVAILLVFGFLDDVRGLGYRSKFAGQLLAAAVVIGYGGVRIESVGMLLPDGVVLAPWLSVPLTVLAILGVTNAINFSDGLDGLAGGIAVLSLGCVGLIAYRVGFTTVALVSVAVSGAVFGFLRFNSHPATIFMGDVGSQFLGFTTIVLGLHLTQTNGPLSPLLPLIILALPVLDTLAVMTQRVWAGRSPFAADRNHLHHKLIGLGLYHADAVRLVYLLQVAAVAAAYRLRYHSDWLLLGGYAGFSALLLGTLYLLQTSRWRIRRYAAPVVDLKLRFRTLKERGVLVKFMFRVLVTGVLGAVLLSCLMPQQLPLWCGAVAAVTAALLGYGWYTERSWAAWGTRLVIFPLVGFLVYAGEVHGAEWAVEPVMLGFNAMVALLVLLALVVVKLTRRRSFRSTPLDLLVLFIAVVLPYLGRDPQHMGVVTAKMLGLFFVVEVFLAELRDEQHWTKVGVLTALALVAVRGLML